jgi:phosphoserine phosphatase
MQKHLATLFPILGALAGAAALPACGDDVQAVQPDAAIQPPEIDAAVVDTCVPKQLSTTLPWYGTNRADLTTWLAAAGCDSAGYDETKKPIATFDWDNTIGKNDFGDAITFYMIANDKVLQPPLQDWKATSPYMTTDAATALTTACGTAIAAGSPLPTSTDTDCAAEMLSIYIDGKTTGALAAFAGHNARMLEPTYAWTAQLLAGYTHAEIAQFAHNAIDPQLTAAMGATQSLGGKTLNGWLRVYDQIKDLIDVTKSYGYDVWIITASPQDVIAAFAPLVGIAADHVIGIRSKTDGNNKLTYTFEGCGTVADNTAAMIPYIQGKRCWLNKVVFGDTTATAMQKRADGKRQYFAAGDSDTDIEFLRDAQYKLVINRNKKELMCHAYYNANNAWRINPMFIEPKPVFSAGYNCSVDACKNESGVAGPCRDDAGNVIPNQVDSVHP